MMKTVNELGKEEASLNLIKDIYKIPQQKAYSVGAAGERPWGERARDQGACSRSIALELWPGHMGKSKK